MSELYCSPDKNSEKITCYSKEDLLLLITAYNNKQSKEYQIKYKNKNKNQLAKELHKRLKSDCDKEWCWLEQNFVPASHSRKLKENFKPEMPEEWRDNPFEWLSTTDIQDVMKQYEKKYPCFLFMGPVSSDCPTEIRCSLSNLTVSSLLKMKKTKLGIIYNLDKHNEPGSHWVAVYFDVNKCKIIYYDSVGMPPPKLILSYLNDLKKDCQNYYKIKTNKTKNVDIYINKTRFQYGGSECGVFSMNFIISMLKNKNIKELNPGEMNDSKMNELRKKYYRPN